MTLSCIYAIIIVMLKVCVSPHSCTLLFVPKYIFIRLIISSRGLSVEEIYQKHNVVLSNYNRINQFQEIVLK